MDYYILNKASGNSLIYKTNKENVWYYNDGNYTFHPKGWVECKGDYTEWTQEFEKIMESITEEEAFLEIL